VVSVHAGAYDALMLVKRKRYVGLVRESGSFKDYLGTEFHADLEHSRSRNEPPNGLEVRDRAAPWKGSAELLGAAVIGASGLLGRIGGR